MLFRAFFSALVSFRFSSEPWTRSVLVLYPSSCRAGPHHTLPLTPSHLLCRSTRQPRRPYWTFPHTLPPRQNSDNFKFAYGHLAYLSRRSLRPPFPPSTSVLGQNVMEACLPCLAPAAVDAEAPHGMARKSVPCRLTTCPHVLARLRPFRPNFLSAPKFPKCEIIARIFGPAPRHAPATSCSWCVRARAFPGTRHPFICVIRAWSPCAAQPFFRCRPPAPLSFDRL